MVESTTTTTIVQNTSGAERTFSFLPPFGKKLVPDETFEFLGDIVSAIQGNRRDFEAYQRALDLGSLILLQTPGSPGWGVGIQTITDLRAVPPEERSDKEVRLVEDRELQYRFDAQGVGVDDGDLIITPDAGTGRWFKIGEGPISDANPIVKGSDDPTKLLRFEIDGLTPATTRVVTMPDKNVLLDDAGDARPPTAHSFAGAEHTAASLAAVNGKVSDATLIDTGDARLSDARTPTAHGLAGAEHTAATLAALNIKVSDNTLIGTDDARLSDARTPTAHSFAGAEHTVATLAAVNGKVSDATLIDTGDARLSDARAPTAHATDHTDGTDDIDGDQVVIDFTPSNYTPDSSPPEAADVDDLAAHLKGIDAAVGAAVNAVPTQADKGLTPIATSGDNASAGVTIAATPISNSDVGLYINTGRYVVGDGIKTENAYFSNDAGTTARLINDIVAGDTLFWNGAISLFDLATTDEVSFDYDIAA